MKWLKFLFIPFLCGLAFIFPESAFSQQLNAPLNKRFSLAFDKASISSSEIVHTSFQPVFASEVKRIDSSLHLFPSLTLNHFPQKKWVARKLFHEHYISLDTASVRLTIDPLVNFEFGDELRKGPNENTDAFYKNTRGFNLKLSIGNNISFESSFRENQAVLPYYLDLRAQQSKVVFGQGRWKRFGDNGYDYSMASGYFSYNIAPWITVQAGHGKHFIGNGQRSLLLSDLSFNYPYLRLSTNWFENKIQYKTLYTSLQNLIRLDAADGSEGLFERKQAALHYLEYSPSPVVSFALFESVMFSSITAAGNQKVGVNFWAPIIGVNTLIEGGEDLGNTLWGTNLKINLFNKLQIYNQLSVFNEDINELSVQVGGKLYVGEKLLFQAEGNMIAENAIGDFTHYGESLTHPLPEGSTELMGLVQYQESRYIGSLSHNVIFNDLIDIRFFDFKNSIIVNPSFNFAFNFGVQYRQELYSSDNFRNSSSFLSLRDEESLFIYLGLSTNLQNLYFNY